MKKVLLIISFFLFTLPMIHSQQKDKMFSNPILAGFYPDPSICRVGDDYYLVNSTFSYYPGIPIHHSKDLVNWELIGYVMERPEQINLEGLGVSRGIFAPAIMHYKGKFYVTCTLVDAGGNFVVTSDKPEGPYSDPYWIPQIDGIDPSMFFDVEDPGFSGNDGKAYILYNSVAPENKPLYDGHRTIRMYEFNLDKMEVVGEEIILVNGGTDLSKKPVWIEGPHILKKDGYYYLIAAEGGTAEEHSEVVFRSREVTGPYISYEKNPILTQRHLDPRREYPITSTGHADIVETNPGEWWAVFLGCRPYPPFAEGFYNTGRETFLAPVEWIEGWPVINPDYEEVQYYYPYPIQPLIEMNDIQHSGNFIYKDDFDGDELNLNWMFLRNPREKWYNLNEKEGYISLKLKPETCFEKVNPVFLGHRQQHLKGSAGIAINFSPETESEKAGILIFQNENHYYFLCKSLHDDIEEIQLYQSVEEDSSIKLIASEKIDKEFSDKDLFLKIVADENKYSFHYSFKPDEWRLLKDNVDASFLSTRIAGGFVGCMYALYATSLGKESNNKAYFDWFEYAGNDEVYK